MTTNERKQRTYTRNKRTIRETDVCVCLIVYSDEHVRQTKLASSLVNFWVHYKIVLID